MNTPPTGRANPAGFADVLAQAGAFHRHGKLTDAERLYSQILQHAPDHFDALRLLGVLRYQQRRYHEARELLEQSLRIHPDSGDAMSKYALVLGMLGQQAEALKFYDKSLIVRPDNPETLNNRGMVLASLQRYEDALLSYDKALALRPNNAETLNNRGNVLQHLRRYDEALASFNAAISARPDYAAALNNRGNVLQDLKRFDEALVAFDQVLAVNPKHAGAHNNLGSVLHATKRYDEALNSFERALAITPDFPEALINRGHTLIESLQFEAALASYDRARALKPDSAVALSGAADAALRMCAWARMRDLGEELTAEIRNGRMALAPFTFFGYCDDPELQLQCARSYVTHKIPTPLPLWNGAIFRHDRIRVAYLSADYHEHATAYLIAGLMELHDRSRFEISGWSFGPDDGSAMRARLVRAFDQFHDVRFKTDGDVAAMMRDREIDVAVDLKGHTQRSRPILAYRPAPIQVGYMGFPATSGANFIDYIIADEMVVPFDQQLFFTEKIVHLPETYWVNDSTRQISEHTPTRREVGLPENAFVFACLSANYKITPKFFDVWMRLLRNVEGSVLWLYRSSGAAEANLRREAHARGIGAERLVFAPMVRPADHLARHRVADLFLDTLPVNAHTTAVDALWAGLPVITVLGRSFVGRVAASLLYNIGLPELVTRSLEDYERLALRLARDPPLLQSFKTRLEANRLTYPLFDTDRFRRHIEAAYLTMWENWQRGQTPRSFAVPALDTHQAQRPDG